MGTTRGEHWRSLAVQEERGQLLAHFRGEMISPLGDLWQKDCIVQVSSPLGKSSRVVRVIPVVDR